MNKKIWLAGILASITILGYQLIQTNKQLAPPIQQIATKPKLVSVNEFKQLSKNPQAFLVDVHTPEQTHIPGTNAFIPYNDIQNNLNQLPSDKNTPILVYCRSGNMSKQASAQLASFGYNNVYDLDGGIKAYQEHNVQVVINPSNQDLGQVVYGDIPTTTFSLTNFTPLPLTITRVSTSCGCTSAQVEDTQLAAYQSTIVNVSFNPAVHKDNTDLGALTRTIYIETDNPNFPRLESTITAYVVNKN